MSKVSLIIAAYNIEKYILKCIESCIHQTYQHIEVIVVDDGSQDETGNLIDSYQVYDCIKVIHQSNQGLIEARKTGYRIATGDYILFIDGDDWLELTAVEKLCQRAVQTQSDVVYYGWFMTNEDGKEMKEIVVEDRGVVDKECFWQYLLEGKIRHCIWSKFIRKDFIDKNGIKFPSYISYAEDLAISYILAIYEPKVAFLNESLYWYLIRKGSLTSTVSKAFLDIIIAIRFIKDELISHKLYEKYKERFEYLAFMHTLYIKLVYIFKIPYRSEWSKEMYNNWRSLEIDIAKNSYFRSQLRGKNVEAMIVEEIAGKSYEEALVIYEQIYAGMK